MTELPTAEQIVDALLSLEAKPVRTLNRDSRVVSELVWLGLIKRWNTWYSVTTRGQQLLSNAAGIPGIRWTLTELRSKRPRPVVAKPRRPWDRSED